MYKKLACIIMLFSLICSFVVPTYASTTPPSCLDDVDKAIVSIHVLTVVIRLNT